MVKEIVKKIKFENKKITEECQKRPTLNEKGQIV